MKRKERFVYHALSLLWRRKDEWSLMSSRADCSLIYPRAEIKCALDGRNYFLSINKGREGGDRMFLGEENEGVPAWKFMDYPAGGRLMFYEWSQLRCTGIPTSLRINGENSRSSAVDDFVTSLRKEATVQSGRGNLYPGKGDLVRPIPNYSPRSSTSLGRGCFCFCLNIKYVPLLVF